VGECEHHFFYGSNPANRKADVHEAVTAGLNWGVFASEYWGI
jgi:hypothetical protein